MFVYPAPLLHHIYIRYAMPNQRVCRSKGSSKSLRKTEKVGFARGVSALIFVRKCLSHYECFQRVKPKRHWHKRHKRHAGGVYFPQARIELIVVFFQNKT